MPVPKQVEDQIKLGEQRLEEQQNKAVPPVGEAPQGDTVILTPPIPPVETTPTPSEADQRYLTLKGKYDAEVPALREELSKVYSELADLKLRLSDAMRTQVASSSAQIEPQSTFNDDLQFVRKEMPEVATFVDARVKEMLDAALREQGARIETSMQNLSNTTSENLTQMFLSRLTDTVPDWEVINNDPRFKAWLSTPDGIGRTLMPTLQDAWRKMNLETTVSIFKAFKQLSSPTRHKEEFIAPDTVSSFDQPGTTTGNAPHLTRQFVQKFYGDLSRGVYRGRPDEAKRIEEMINLATQAGTIT